MTDKNSEDYLMSITTLAELLGYSSRTTIYKFIAEDPDFPHPVQTGSRSTRFRASEVTEYIRRLPTKRQLRRKLH